MKLLKALLAAWHCFFMPGDFNLEDGSEVEP